MRQANQYVRMQEEEPGGLGLAPEASTVNSRGMQTLNLQSLDSLELETEEMLTENSRLLQAHHHESPRHGADTAMSSSSRSSRSSMSARYGNPDAVWHFVESGWFQGLAASAILVNLLVMGLEANNFGSSSFQEGLLAIDNVLLCFYLFELCARALYFRGKYLCGEFSFTAWNYLDVVVVAAGVADQWLISLLPHNISERLEAPLRILRFLRVFRALKIVRIFLESDLSWTESPKFQSFIGLVIAFNSVLMGLETDIKWEGWSIMELTLLVIYTFELSCNLKRSGCFFFSCSNSDFMWNILDFSIVASSIADSWLVPLATVIANAVSSGDHHSKHQDGGGIPIGQLMMLMRMLRLLRILRLIKLVKSVRPLFMLVQGMLTSLQGVFWVLVLTIVALYASGLVATRLIGHALVFPDEDVPEHVIHSFSTVPNSMFTLFRVMCGSSSEDESEAIDWMLEEKPTAKFAFVFFMVTSSWTLLSILTAVVSERMISTTEQQHKELQLSQHEESQLERKESLKLLFAEIDTSEDGHLSKEEIESFLEDKEKFAEVSRMCNVSMLDIREVIQTIYRESMPDIEIEVFIEMILVAGEQVTEKSIMKLNRRLDNFEDSMEAQFEALKKFCVAPKHQTQQQHPLQPQQQQKQQGDVQVDQPADQQESVVLVSEPFLLAAPPDWPASAEPGCVQHHVDAAFFAPEAYRQLRPLREALDQNAASMAAKLEQLAEQTCTHTDGIARLQQAIEEAVVVRLDTFRADQAARRRLPSSVDDSSVSAEHSKQGPQWPTCFPEFLNHDRFADMSPDNGGAQKEWAKAVREPISPSTRGSTVDQVEFQVPEAWALQPRPV